MTSFSALLAICEGTSPVPGEFPKQGPVTRSFDVFFDLRINGWVNTGEAGDLRRHRAHYDVIVIWKKLWTKELSNSLCLAGQVEKWNIWLERLQQTRMQ